MATFPISEFVFRHRGRGYPMVAVWHGDGRRIAEVSCRGDVDADDLDTQKTMAAADWITDELARGTPLGEVCAHDAGLRVERLVIRLQAIECRGFRGKKEAVSCQLSAVSEERAEGCRLTAEGFLGLEWRVPL